MLHPRRAGMSLRVAIWVGVVLTGGWLAFHMPDAWLRRWYPNSRPELTELVAAVGEQRIVEGRLSGGFAWGQPPSPARAQQSLSVTIAPEIQSAAADLMRRAAGDRSAIGLAALGTAYLSLAQFQPAIDALEEATALDPGLSYAWSDLAVAYLGRQTSAGIAADVPRALEAVEHALAGETPPSEALFNRALALERLGLIDRALEAWRAAASVDTGASAAGWVGEARSHADDLTQRRQKTPNDRDLQAARERLFDDVLTRLAESVVSGRNDREAIAREAGTIVELLGASPGDRLAADVVARVRAAMSERDRTGSALWEGHRAYGLARAHYKYDRIDAAAPLFESATRDLERARSPLAWSARLYGSLVAYRRRDLGGAERQLAALLPRLQDASYASLVGRTSWTLGVLVTQRGAYIDAARSYRVALAAFEQAGERANAAFIHTLLADNYDRRGEPERGWHDRLLALAGNRREATLLTTAYSALRVDWPNVAALLQEDAAALARAGRRMTNLVDALHHQAQTRMYLGQSEAAARLLAEAREVVTTHLDSSWDRLRAEVDLTTAQLAATAPTTTPAVARPAVAIAMRAHDYFSSAKATRRVPETLLVLAKLKRIAGDIDSARADLSRALEIVVGERDAIPVGPERMAFAETARQIGDARISLEIAAGHADRALVEADRVRTWDLGPSTRESPVLDLESLRARLSADTAIIYYALGDRESFAWVIRREGMQVRPLTTDRREIRRIVTNTFPDRLEADGIHRLRAAVLRPIEETIATEPRLIIIPDGALHAVAFAAMPGRRARFLVEEHVLSEIPSLSALLTASMRLRELPGDARSIVTVGNPRLDPDRAPELLNLAGAATEARRIASLYDASHVLVAGDATTEALIAALPVADVFHFAGHGIVNGLYPEESQLGIPNQEGLLLSASTLRTWSLPRLRLAVLAACESAGRRSARTQGPMSFARALLQAGVPAVVANRWLVDDRASVGLAVAFHEAYRQTADAALALQRAQVSMINSNDLTLRRPSAWAGWTFIGGSLRIDEKPGATDRVSKEDR